MTDRPPSLSLPSILSSGASTNNTLSWKQCKDSMVVNRKFAAFAMKKNQPKNPVKAVLAGM